MIRVFTVLAVVGAMVIMYFVSRHMDEFRRYAGSPLGLLLFFVLSAVSSATLILPVPGLALTSVLGTAAHPLLIGIIGGVGQTIGELTGYLAGYSGHTLVQDTPRYEQISGWMRRYGVLALFVLGLVPNPLFYVARIAAGALRMPVRRFLLGAGAGKILKNIAFAYTGAYVFVLAAHWLRTLFAK